MTGHRELLATVGECWYSYASAWWHGNIIWRPVGDLGVWDLIGKNLSWTPEYQHLILLNTSLHLGPTLWHMNIIIISEVHSNKDNISYHMTHPHTKVISKIISYLSSHSLVSCVNHEEKGILTILCSKANYIPFIFNLCYSDYRWHGYKFIHDELAGLCMQQY